MTDRQGALCSSSATGAADIANLTTHCLRSEQLRVEKPITPAGA
jgi:hypothetical protein